MKNSSRIAIIVPYRDTPGQKRKEQLDFFLKYMKEYTNAHIFIIEQKQQDLLFNRGALLNIGSLIAKEKGYNVLILHDVDLIPSIELEHLYTTPLLPNTVVHIAHCWKRYDSPYYLGGIVKIRTNDYFKIGGFPNIFWGWGSEDDEFRKRVIYGNLKIIKPKCTGTIIDLEQLSLKGKLRTVEKSKIRKEVAKEHDLMRKRAMPPNWWGPYIDFDYTITKKTSYYTIYSVNLGSNNHWTDKFKRA